MIRYNKLQSFVTSISLTCLMSNFISKFEILKFKLKQRIYLQNILIYIKYRSLLFFLIYDNKNGNYLHHFVWIIKKGPYNFRSNKHLIMFIYVLFLYLSLIYLIYRISSWHKDKRIEWQDVSVRVNLYAC